MSVEQIPSLANLRAAGARLKRELKSRPNDDLRAQVKQHDAAYAAAKMADFIRRTVDAAPPLSAGQRSVLAAIFSGGK